MQQSLYQVASDVAKANLTDLALEYVGRGQNIKMTSNYGSNAVQDWKVIARRIRKLPAEQRYQRLKDWTLPKEGRQTVRFVSTWNPPAGKELSDFYAPEIRDLPEASLPGLNSNFLDLIDAAAQAGKVDDLKSALDTIDTKKHPEIEALKVCVAVRTEDTLALDMVKAYLKGHAERSKDAEDQYGRTLPNQEKYSWCDHLVFRLVTQKHPAESDIFEEHRERIFTFDLGTSRMARRDYEKAQAKTLQTKLQPGTVEPLSYWTMRKSRATGLQPWTVCDNDRLTQLGTIRPDAFWLNYPLKGDFKFSVEATSMGAAGVSFGGVKVNAVIPEGNRVQVSGLGNRDKIYRRIKSPPQAHRFAKLTIEVLDNVLQYSLDGNLIYEEKLAGTYPWLFLHSQPSAPATWRNPVFEVKPEIAQKIQLVAGDRIEGWAAANEKQANFRFDAEPKPKKPQGDQAPKKDEPDELDWYAKDGVLHGKADEDAAKGADSLISYHRPLAEGDQFSYEFLYEPGTRMANPMIGRVVVNLANGEKAQELYAGDEEIKDYPTIINIVNSPHALEPVKLTASQWNQVTLRIKDANAEVEVNGDIVWRRPLTKLDSQKFGIQKYKTQATEVRNMTLSGDWPAEFPESLATNIFKSERRLEAADRNLVAEVLGNRFNSLELHAFYAKDRADESDETRYQKLRDWVLPGYGHGIRLNSLSVAKDIRTTEQLAADEHSSLHCPAWEMISLANEIGKLSELTETINGLEVPAKKTTLKYRNVNALHALLALASGDDKSARSHMKAIYGSIAEIEAEGKKKKNRRNTSYDRSAVLVTSWFAAARPKLSGIAESLGRKCPGNNDRTRITARVERFASSSAGQPLTQWDVIPAGANHYDQHGRYLDRWRMVSRGLFRASLKSRQTFAAATPIGFGWITVAMQ